MAYESLVDQRIREAMESGAFSGLRGEGAPLRVRPGEALAGDNWLGFHILENAGTLPAWLLLAREIEDDLGSLERMKARYRELVDLARTSPDPERFEGLLADRRSAFADFARAVRRKQDRFNIEAPGILSERPGIWVEHEVARLDA